MRRIRGIGFVVACVSALAIAASGAVAQPDRPAGPPPPIAMARCEAATITFEHVTIPRAVVANGAPLAAGTYQVRITAERPAPAPGQAANAECWVEFVANGSVAGREVASVIAGAEIPLIAKGPPPAPHASRVDVLKGDEFVRVWMNAVDAHYLVNLTIERVR